MRSCPNSTGCYNDAASCVKDKAMNYVTYLTSFASIAALIFAAWKYLDTKKSEEKNKRFEQFTVQADLDLGFWIYRGRSTSKFSSSGDCSLSADGVS